MAIIYQCRHCRHQEARIDETVVSEEALGLQILTSDERKDIMTYDSDGNMRILITCEYCQEAMERSPELLLLTNPLQ